MSARTLVFSIGNTTIFGGVFSGGRLVQTFRLAPGELGQLSARVRGRIDAAAFCSVVPAATRAALGLVRRTWRIEPRVLTAESAHGLKIGYRRPRELGADRVASALGARVCGAGGNAIVVDCGTATTVTALRRDGTLLGGAIFPGFALWAEVLAARTAQLPRVVTVRPRAAVGRSPREGIAAGVFFGHVGAIRETVARVRAEAFGRAKCLVIGTGGNAPRFAGEALFDRLEPNLTLIGLQRYATAGA